MKVKEFVDEHWSELVAFAVVGGTAILGYACGKAITNMRINQGFEAIKNKNYEVYKNFVNVLFDVKKENLLNK